MNIFEKQAKNFGAEVLEDSVINVSKENNEFIIHVSLLPIIDLSIKQSF